MYADSEPHLENLASECTACSQLCIWEETEWACTSCGRVHRRSQLDYESPSRVETLPTARDDTYGSDEELAAGDHPTSMVDQGGPPWDFRALLGNGVGQLEHSQNEGDSKTFPSDTGAKQGSHKSDVENRDIEEVGPGEDDDPMEVDDDDEEVYRTQVVSWVSRLPAVCMGERLTDIEHILWQVDNLAFTPTPLEMLAAGNEVELSDDMEMDE